MSAPAAELQKAIFSTLGEDKALAAAIGSRRIYDEAPVNVAFPYISFGRTSVYDWSTGKERDGEQLFTLHIWSKAKGNQETLDIMKLARARLAEVTLPLDKHAPVSLHLEFAEERYDEDLSVHHGLLRFRAVTSEAEKPRRQAAKSRRNSS
jgi:hypothetical protein